MMYMLIDTTATETCQVLLVGSMHRIQMWGRLYKSQGKSVIGPPLEGRGFSKLDKPQLQYLFWNHCKRTPPEDYEELIRQCLIQIRFIKPDTHPIEDLERQVAKLEAENTDPTQPKHKKERVAKDPNAPLEPPKKTSTTGLVWVIADELCVKFGRMATRQEVIAACTEEGINGSTASTQFSKWKGSKNIGQTHCQE